MQKQWFCWKMGAMGWALLLSQSFLNTSLAKDSPCERHRKTVPTCVDDLGALNDLNQLVKRSYEQCVATYELGVSLEAKRADEENKAANGVSESIAKVKQAKKELANDKANAVAKRYFEKAKQFQKNHYQALSSFVDQLKAQNEKLQAIKEKSWLPVAKIECVDQEGRPDTSASSHLTAFVKGALDDLKAAQAHSNQMMQQFSQKAGEVQASMASFAAQAVESDKNIASGSNLQPSTLKNEQVASIPAEQEQIREQATQIDEKKFDQALKDLENEIIPRVEPDLAEDGIIAESGVIVDKDGNKYLRVNTPNADGSPSDTFQNLVLDKEGKVKREGGFCLLGCKAVEQNLAVQDGKIVAVGDSFAAVSPEGVKADYLVNNFGKGFSQQRHLNYPIVAAEKGAKIASLPPTNNVDASDKPNNTNGANSGLENTETMLGLDSNSSGPELFADNLFRTKAKNDSNTTDTETEAKSEGTDTTASLADKDKSRSDDVSHVAQVPIDSASVRSDRDNGRSDTNGAATTHTTAADPAKDYSDFAGMTAKDLRGESVSAPKASPTDISNTNARSANSVVNEKVINQNDLSSYITKISGQGKYIKEGEADALAAYYVQRAKSAHPDNPFLANKMIADSLATYGNESSFGRDRYTESSEGAFGAFQIKPNTARLLIQQYPDQFDKSYQGLSNTALAERLENNLVDSARLRDLFYEDNNRRMNQENPEVRTADVGIATEASNYSLRNPASYVGGRKVAPATFQAVKNAEVSFEGLDYAGQIRTLARGSGVIYGDNFGDQDRSTGCPGCAEYAVNQAFYRAQIADGISKNPWQVKAFQSRIKSLLVGPNAILKFDEDSGRYKVLPKKK